jgi:hypothetical protein
MLSVVACPICLSTAMKETVMSKAQNFDITNYEVADLNALRSEAAKMQAEEMARLFTAFKAWTKNLFSFGFMRHA